jgi:hypothetical protein
VGEIYLLPSLAYTGDKEERAMRYELAELFNQTYFFIYQQPLYIKANHGGALA